MKHKEVVKLVGAVLITSGMITGCARDNIELLYGPAPMVMGGDQGIRSGESIDTEIDIDTEIPEYNPSNDVVADVYGPAPVY